MSLSARDLRYLASLVERDLRAQRRRYGHPAQVARRGRIAAEGGRDAAAWKIERTAELLGRLRERHGEAAASARHEYQLPE